MKQPVAALSVSKGAIDRAGETLRDWWLQPLVALTVPEEAAEILFAFRAEFQNPMKKVTVGLRQFVGRETPATEPVTVGQRLKRAPQIVEKLGRHPGMKLARMQDIGGCRAILPGGLDEVRRIAIRVERNWTIKHRKHYTLREPATSGYRALHLVIERDNRLVEIQLRTPRQHAWAEAIERTDKRLGLNMKAGDGPHALLSYFKLAGDGLAIEDEGLSPGSEFLRNFNEARVRVEPYLDRS